MTDKEKIRESVSRLIIPESECEGMGLMEKGRQYAYREVLDIIDSTSEEHVSEDLKKGLPIRNVTVDPMGGEMRHRTAEYMKSIGCDARFIGDDALIKAVNVKWPKGTEVVVYCHKEDREAVSREVEQKGYKIAAFVDVDDDWLGEMVIKRGQYVMTKKEPIDWNFADAKRPFGIFESAHEAAQRGMAIADSVFWSKLIKKME